MTLDAKTRERRVKNGNTQKLKEEEAYEKRNIDPIVKNVKVDREKRDSSAPQKQDESTGVIGL